MVAHLLHEGFRPLLAGDELFDQGMLSRTVSVFQYCQLHNIITFRRLPGLEWFWKITEAPFNAALLHIVLDVVVPFNLRNYVPIFVSPRSSSLARVQWEVQVDGFFQEFRGG